MTHTVTIEDRKQSLRSRGITDRLLNPDFSKYALSILLSEMLPMSTRDFGDWRFAVDPILKAAGYRIAYYREGYHVYGLDQQPNDYVPLDHAIYVAGPIMSYEYNKSLKSLYRCRGCGRSVEVTQPSAEECILLGCMSLKIPTVFGGQWLQSIGTGYNTM